MQVFRSCILTILFFACTSVFAESYRMNANYFVRSSPDFSSHYGNKVGVLTRGTRFNVLRSIPMAGGAEALEIHVTGLARHGNLQVSKHYWVYKSKDSHFTQLNRIPRDTQAGSTDLPCKNCGQVQPPNPNRSDIGDVATTITRQDNEADDEDEDTPVDPAAPLKPGGLDTKIKKLQQLICC